MAIMEDGELLVDNGVCTAYSWTASGHRMVLAW